MNLVTPVLRELLSERVNAIGGVVFRHDGSTNCERDLCERQQPLLTRAQRRSAIADANSEHFTSVAPSISRAKS